MMLPVGTLISFQSWNGRVIGHAVAFGEEEVNVVELSGIIGPRRFVLVRYINGVPEVL